MEILLKSGAAFLIFSLVLAWLLVAVKFLGLFGKIFANQKYLLSSHLDYIFMAILNWLVYLLYAQLKLAPNAWVACLIIAGSALNPFLFLVMSVNPEIKKSPFSPFGMFSSFSFVLTTAGYGWACYEFIRVI